MAAILTLPQTGRLGGEDDFSEKLVAGETVQYPDADSTFRCPIILPTNGQ